jgi:hypothetical protein
MKNYGNDLNYLTARIARDRLDILERMKAGEYRTVRQAAIDAGIIRRPHPDDVSLEALLKAWRNADEETRQLFLLLIEEWQENLTVSPGPQPYYSAEESAASPEIEARITVGESVSAVARSLGISYRTLARWRAGQTKPRKLKATCCSEEAVQ